VFDILPSSPPPRRVPRRQRLSRRLTPQRPPVPSVPSPGPRTVKLQWQLPARLRRPVRQELARQRKSQKYSQSLVQFERRPVLTQLPPARPVAAEVRPPDASLYPAAPTSTRMQLTPPPYRGSFASETPTHEQRPLDPMQVEIVSRDVVPSKSIASAVVQKSRTRPLQARDTTSSPAKKKIWRARHLLPFLVTALGLASLIWILQGAGRGTALLGTIEGRAGKAYEQVLVAQAALAETDFVTSEASFAAAGAELQQARQELDAALAASRVVLETVDLTGTVRSGRELLVAGEAVTTAGQHVSRGLNFIVTAQVLPSAETQTPALTLVDAIGQAQPELAQAAAALTEAETSLQQVESERLPENLQEPVRQLQRLVPSARAGVQSFLDHSGLLLNVLGADRDRQYLVLFENNHELRPTGGFIGSIALINMSRGVVEDIDVQSVYDPDGQLIDVIAPPEPLRTITNRWYLRDANWFADFEVSARKIADFLEKEKGPTVDGVMALTPEVIAALLRITGPIEVPQHGVTVTSDNFVELTQDRVTYNYDRERNQPKQFLADLTPLLLNRLFATAGKSGWESLGVFEKVLSEKHLLLYFRDPQLQARLVEAGWAGKLTPVAPAFLSVNNANIGGHKSDEFIEQEIDYRVTVQADLTAEAVVTIRRTHHGPTEVAGRTYPAGENPGEKNNIVWQRVFVPADSELLDASGFTAPAAIAQQFQGGEPANLQADPLLTEWQQQQRTHPSGTILGAESGLQYFANWIVTRPGETTVGLYRYRLPGRVAVPSLVNLFETYALQVAKQPGDTRTTVRTELLLPESVRAVRTVPEDGVTYTNDHQLVYRGALRRDLVTGAVFERK
jgi:hypothetical protein